MDNLSIYTAYSTSFLPASGDQFSALNNGTLIIQPQKFENKEVGVKWNIYPRLQYTAAAYELKRTNVPIADPSNAGFFLLSGSHRIRGFETALNGYVTPDWQSSFGYAYTDARITGATLGHRSCPATACSLCRSISSPGGTSISSIRPGPPRSA